MGVGNCWIKVGEVMPTHGTCCWVRAVDGHIVPGMFLYTQWRDQNRKVIEGVLEWKTNEGGCRWWPY